MAKVPYNPSTGKPPLSREYTPEVHRSISLALRIHAEGINALYAGAQPAALPSYTVTTLPSAATYIGALIFVSNEAGGAVPAFSDGTDWRRVTDRAVVS